ncbi:MAG: SIR2 family protein [Bacteroidetes bacterium]|nr:SIR2 family protein [Bacteroidota bacterium]
MEPQSIPQISLDDFTRRFGLRAPNLMWLLGAGASAAAGIPTAWDMVWEFKQRLFVHQRKVSPKSVSDLSNPSVRAQLQGHIDSAGNLPGLNSIEEYAALFEAVYPAEADRRAYIAAKTSGARPSYGHLVLATLMKAGRTKLVWTTNFDHLVADACAKVFETTGALTSVGLEGTDIAAQLIGEERWPLEVKIHGDFRSRRLKNTANELQEQDVRFRQSLVDCCRRFGLIAIGYSGRDESVMSALEEALKQPGAFPAGLFWLHRGDGPPLPRVAELLRHAALSGVEAAVVQVDNFDEVLRDVARPMEDLDVNALETFANERKRWSPAPVPGGNRGWPIVRLNALPMVTTPATCRRIVCDIGGYKKVREAVADAGVNVLTARVRAGVLAFGSDADVRAALDQYDIQEFDLHSIEPKRLRYDSGERGLLRDALTQALMRQHGMTLLRRRSTDLLTPGDLEHEKWKGLSKCVNGLKGTVPEHAELTWQEGVGTRLDWASDRLWLLFEPRLVFHGLTASNRAVAADFGRERVIKRYNRPLNDLIQFWSTLLAADGAELRSLGIADGIDAVFRLDSTTAYSRRASA